MGTPLLACHPLHMPPCLGDVRFRVRELSCSQNDRQTDRQNDRSHYSASFGGHMYNAAYRPHHSSRAADSADWLRQLTCGWREFKYNEVNYTTVGRHTRATELNFIRNDIMPTGWTPAAASSTLEEWTRTFSRGQQCSCSRITVFYGVRSGQQKVCEWGPKIWKI